jgi:hypothetical protein
VTYLIISNDELDKCIDEGFLGELQVTGARLVRLGLVAFLPPILFYWSLRIHCCDWDFKLVTTNHPCIKVVGVVLCRLGLKAVS